MGKVPLVFLLTEAFPRILKTEEDESCDRGCDRAQGGGEFCNPGLTGESSSPGRHFSGCCQPSPLLSQAAGMQGAGQEASASLGQHSELSRISNPAAELMVFRAGLCIRCV